METQIRVKNEHRFVIKSLVTLFFYNLPMIQICLLNNLLDPSVHRMCYHNNGKRHICYSAIYLLKNRFYYMALYSKIQTNKSPIIWRIAFSVFFWVNDIEYSKCFQLIEVEFWIYPLIYYFLLITGYSRNFCYCS